MAAKQDNLPCSIRALSRALNRSPSTISREVRRLEDGAYDATQAALPTTGSNASTAAVGPP